MLMESLGAPTVEGPTGLMPVPTRGRPAESPEVGISPPPPPGGSRRGPGLSRGSRHGRPEASSEAEVETEEREGAAQAAEEMETGE